MIRLHDMVDGGSVTAEGAAILRDIATGGHSFLVFALPRNAGKTTLTQAVLAEAPADLARRDYYGTEEETQALGGEAPDGYLVVGEIGHRGRRGYLAGEEIQRLFELVGRGWAVASSLHADTVDQVFDVLGRNGVDARTAAAVRYLIKVRALGDPDSPDTARVVESIHEVELADGQPSSQLLYSWAGLASHSPA